VVRENGSTFLVEVRGKMIPYDGKTLRVTAIRDIQARSDRERKQRESEQQLRDLAARLLEIREEERGTMAREIHDVLGQSLSALRIDLSWINNSLSSQPPEIGERIREMVANLDSTLDTMRELSTRLRPSVLDDLGLAAAIEWQVSEFARRTETRCDLDLGEEGIEIDRGRDIAIFRILQEALTNVARHAGADRVRVCLRREEGDLILEIEDDGKGTGMEDLSGHRALGVLGMRERARGQGGVIVIRRGSEGGTMVTLKVPIGGPTREL
jgi:signal transduction histidine kinase